MPSVVSWLNGDLELDWAGFLLSSQRGFSKYEVAGSTGVERVAWSSVIASSEKVMPANLGTALRSPSARSFALGNKSWSPGCLSHPR